LVLQLEYFDRYEILLLKKNKKLVTKGKCKRMYRYILTFTF